MAYARIKPIIPKKSRLLSPKRMQKALDRTLDKCEAKAIELYEKTVKTWKTQPTFKARRYRYITHVYTTEKRYRWIDLGVPGRVIVPRRKRLLRISTGFKAKTRPRTLSSYKGSIGGYAWAKSVDWPGIEAREFTIRVAEEMSPFANVTMRKEIRDALQ